MSNGDSFEVEETSPFHSKMTKNKAPSSYSNRSNPPADDNYGEKRTQAMQKLVNIAMGEDDRELATKLSNKIASEKNTYRMLLFYEKHKSIILRPVVFVKLGPRRTKFMEALTELTNQYFEKIQQVHFQSTTDEKIPGIISGHVEKIAYLQGINMRAGRILDISKSMLSDLEGFERHRQNVLKLGDKIKEEEANTFNEWVTKRRQDFKREGISLKLNDPVIEFEEGSKEMTVTYNAELIHICEDTMQLSSMGFEIPEDLVESVKTASNLIIPAKMLVEVARFHNTVGDTMVKAQRPMMLESAVMLSKMVKDQKSVTWGNPAEVNAFIMKLTEIVEQLGQQNEHLARSHKIVMGKIFDLYTTDLIKQRKKWKETVREVAAVVKNIEECGYKNVKGWQVHLDHQFYKVLDAKYKECLISMHQILPEIRCEMICSNGLIQYKPPLEELRAIFIGHCNKVFTIPHSFEGLIQDKEFFTDIASTDFAGRHQAIMFARESKLVVRLIKLQDKFSKWVFSTADLEKLHQTTSRTPEDWETQFRYSKQRAQDINLVDFSDDKVGCFIINYNTLRFAIEMQNREYLDILTRSLTKSISEDMKTLKSFLTESIEALNSDPDTLEEITEASVVKEKVELEMKTMQQLWERFDKKNEILMSWTKSSFDSEEIKSLWKEFEDLLGNHQQILGRQIDNIKHNLRSEADTVIVEINNFKIKWDQLKPKDKEITRNPAKLDKAIEYINEMQLVWYQLNTRRDTVLSTCAQLSVPTSDFDFSVADEVDKDLGKYEQIWGRLSSFRKELKEFEEEDWIIFRSKPYRFEEFLDEWDNKLRNGEMSEFIVEMIKDIEEHRSIVPNLKYIRGDSFTEKHWANLFSILGIQNKPLGELKVGDFLAVRSTINDKLEELKELNSRASGEITVRQALNELDAWEIESTFQLSEHKDSSNSPISIIQDFKPVINKLGDNQSLLISIRTSPFYSHFEDRIEIWENKIGDLTEYINSLNKIQRRWIYLEPVFSQGVLDHEQARFRRIDEDFKIIMQQIAKDCRVVSLCKMPGIRSRLETMKEQLAVCKDSLNEFLENKRKGFPRFYFIGDDDLLEILGQSTKPTVIQAHLKKLYAGIYNVDFDSNFAYITAMKSQDGEIVKLKSPVKLLQNVEQWLGALSEEMCRTLQSMLLDCIADTKRNSNNPAKYPSQILCLSNAIIFTDRCEEAIRSGGLQSFIKNLRQDLEMYTNQRVQGDGNDKSDADNVLVLKLKDVILDLIHHIDIVEYLIRYRVRNVADWNWHKQLRFYIGENGIALIKMADAEFSYSYEYQGNVPKLVHTPLTDKCYLTLTQGMRMGLGGNPYGPAGTGKTESVKALGNLLGRQVLVFNCDEGIDVKSMGRIFTGLAQCGAWGCFDEFNRLDNVTLSAISLQIQPIQVALKENHSTVNILNTKIPLDPNCGIFVTLNPAGQGYGGRNKLPDNLKQLFRPVVMSQPDNERIAEVILYTEGFKNAKNIGSKLVEVFNLSFRLLTPQTHYDWGLRALKTVLKGCGAALTEYKKNHSSEAVSEEDEINTVVATLRLNTLPKLTYSDCIRFDSLIKDIFSSAVFRDLGNHELAEHVRSVYQELRLQVNENQVNKCLELYEQLQQRMGVVIVGPSCCGKSTVLTVLQQALLRMGHSIKTHVMNPKAMPRVHLLGQINLDTRQWTDGVLTMKAQQVYSEPPEVTSWIICDGDIDPEWIESLNSVLDDNRLLTLPSGWRIKFGPNVNFVFETHDLSLASPATISRMGMIFMSDEDADVKGVVNSWLSSQPSENQSMLKSLIDDYFYKGLSIVANIQEPIIAIPLITVAKNALSLMERVTTPIQMAVALIRGLGGHLQQDQLVPFANSILREVKQAEMKNPLAAYYNPRTNRLEQYTDEPLSKEDSSGIGLSNSGSNLPVVKTADVLRVLDHIRPWLEARESFLLIGSEGCGKSVILEYAFKQLRSTEVATIHCSGLIAPENVIQKLSQVCITMSTNAGRVYKSKDSEKLILYFKDINLVKPDKWRTCQLVEFLRQIIVYGGFYDKHLEWVTVQGIQIVASITASDTGGRFQLSPRFTSRIHICSMSEPLPSHLTTVCHTYLNLLLPLHCPNHPITKRAKEVEAIATEMVTVYKEVRKAFTPVAHSHYLFTPRDLTKWVLNLMRYACIGSDEKASIEDFRFAWAYEACRIFRDKLVSDQEKRQFDDAILSPILTQWGYQNIGNTLEQFCWASTFASGVVNPQSKLGSTTIIGTELHKLKHSEMATIAEKGAVVFGRETRTLSVAIIPELVNNVAYLDRILSSQSSHVLMAGRAGVGRRSALSIVSALHHASIFTLKVGKKYGVKQFKLDLKAAIQASAVEGNRIFLVVEDYQLVNVIFLDMLNSLLSSGEIPGLYTPEELDIVVSQLRDVAASEGYNLNLHSYFAHRIQSMLHVILIMDFTNPNFIKNCQSNPALYKQCNLVWLEGWTPETMAIFPFECMKKFYSGQDSKMCGFESDFGDEQKKEQFLDGFLMMYQTMDKYDKDATCPRNFATLIHNYALIYNSRRKFISSKVQRLQAGISKLDEATRIVEELRSTAREHEKLFQAKQDEANRAMEMISSTLQNSNVQKGELEEMRKKALAEKEILAQKKAAIDVELSEIEPLVRQAQAAIGNLKNESITEIRSLRAPPDIIRDILEGVLHLMGTRDMSWNSMKTFLSKRGVKDEIRTFDARNIDPSDREAVEKMLKVKHASFDPKNSKRASAAAAPLAEWVTANVKYAKVLEKIDPLEKYKEALEHNLRATESSMNEISDGLTTVDEKVKALTERYKQCSSEAMNIQFQLEKSQVTLTAAEGLVGKLGEEFTRWNQELTELDAKVQQLPLEALLAAGFITFLSNMSEDDRYHCLNVWSEYCGVESFDFCKFICTERDLLHWQGLGLPSDKLSEENAVAVQQTCLRPLLVDPSSRAQSWLMNYLAEIFGETIQCPMHDERFTTELELAIRFGKTVIITEVDSIEPILIPILRRDIVTQGSRELIPVGDKLVDYNHNFRLFLTTKNPNPFIPPDADAVLTVVNFTTTRSGLTSQLLTITLSTEQPEIQEKKSSLLKNIEQLKIKKEDVGDELLKELASAQGNILENKELLASLKQAKASALQIDENLSQSAALEDELNVQIDVYRPFAEFVSKLYFAIVNVSKLNQMYQFSLQSFISLFEKTLKERSYANNLEQRIRTLTSNVLDVVYEYICRALFNADRMAFTLHLLHSIFTDKFQPLEWEAFTGQLVLNVKDSNNRENIPDWIPEDRRFPVQIIMTGFPELYNKLELHRKENWLEFYSSNECEEQIPQNVKESLTEFQKVMLINVLRPDRLLTSMYNFGRTLLGRKSLFPGHIAIRQVYKQSSATEPILLIVSPGSDPSQEIRELAKEVVGLGNYIEMSSGDVRNGLLEKIVQACEQGKWVCVKNLHLIIGELETLNIQRTISGTNPNFRLWLTTEPHSLFPKTLAQASLKVAYEPPEGVKKNIQRTYESWSPEYFTGQKNTIRCQALFVLATFHAIVQERRTYIPQGWSTYYEFNDSDLRAGADVIDKLFQGRPKDFQWEYIHGLFENAIYGGRIDNEYDNRVLVTYLKEYFSEVIITNVGGNPSSKKSFGPNITVPNSTKIEDYLGIVNTIPENDRPSFFGLASNIEKSWQKNVSSQVINQLKILCRGLDNVEAFDKAYWSQELTPVMKLWKSLSQSSNLQTLYHQVLTPPGVKANEGSLNPIDSFVRLEHYNIILLAQKIHKSLGFLSRVLRGVVVPTDEASVIAKALIAREVPDSWRQIWDGPSDSTLYITELVRKAEKVNGVWMKRSMEGNLLGQSVYLSDLINPDTFFSAFKQHCARRRGVSMDELEFTCVWDRSSVADASNNLFCRLKGILLEGCVFKAGRLQENKPEDPPAVEVSECIITWVGKKSMSPKREIDMLTKASAIPVPLYANESRKKLIGTLDMPIQGDMSKWIKTGIALFLR